MRQIDSVHFGIDGETNIQFMFVFRLAAFPFHLATASTFPSSIMRFGSVNGFELLEVRGGNLFDASAVVFDPFPQITFVGINDGGAGI